MRSSGWRDWLDHRTGLPRTVRHFLDEPVPASIGWLNTLGSLAGALLLLQIVSGFLLALYYVPHPEAAYASLEYVEKNLTAGALVRALHYWGASFIIVAIFLHMARVFVSGAYRTPRELTWVFGVLLLLVVVTLAFTGQLLPWDQMGYWAANVGIEIGSSAPFAGPYVKRMLLGGDSLGAVTLTRFYAMHVILLPGILGILVAGHLYLLRRHGAARPARDTGTETAAFYPSQFARDMIAITIGLAALIAVAWIVGGPHSGPADPGDTAYVPHPEWYFQSQYQLLRFTPGPLKLLATFIIPTIVLVTVVALPWIDRSPSSAVRDRQLVVAGGGMVLWAVVALTIFGVVSSRPEAQTQPVNAATYDAVEAGRKMFVKLNCRKCHTVGLEGGDEGPDLSGVGLRLQEPYMRKFLVDPKAFIPDIDMPAVNVSQQELNELIAYLNSLRDQSGM